MSPPPKNQGAPSSPPAEPAPPAAAPGLFDQKRVVIKTKERLVVHDDGEGNWLVSYADMMTLLFAFFVILSAFSTPDAKKMEKLKQETAKAMGTKYTKPYEDLSQSIKKVLKEFQLDKEIIVEETDSGLALISRG